MFPLGCDVRRDNAEHQVTKTAQAVGDLREIAMKGNVAAQMELGTRYIEGKGVSADPSEAFRWFRMAADNGETEAENQVGLMYAEGNGVVKDKTQAMNWFQAAADKGLAKAQFNLGFMYQSSIPLIVDHSSLQEAQHAYANAKAWYQKAINQGHQEAVYNLQVLEKQMHGP